MRNTDQTLLEEAYDLVKEQKASSEWQALPEESSSRKTLCICGSGKMFNECCGKRIVVGDLVTVISDEKALWLDVSNMKPEYKSQWQKAVNKVGELIGCKWIAAHKVYTPKKSWGANALDSTALLYGIKLLDGKIYAIDRDLIQEPTSNQIKEYKGLKSLHNEFPEIQGTFNI